MSDTHEAIIPIETYELVQSEIEKRKDKYLKDTKYTKNPHPFSGLIKCPRCGIHYRRKKTYYTVAWVCSTSSQKGKDACGQTQTIPEDILTKATCEVLGLENLDVSVLHKKVEKIIPIRDNVLLFQMKDGNEIIKEWNYHSRKTAWTEEKRKEFGEKLKEKNKKCPK